MVNTGLAQQSPDEGQSRRAEAGKKREEPVERPRSEANEQGESSDDG